MRDNTRQLVNFHKSGIKLVKKTLGSKCLFLSHQKEGQANYLKCILKNSEGGKDTIYYEVTKEPSQMSLQDYQELANLLKEKFYEKPS